MHNGVNFGVEDTETFLSLRPAYQCHFANGGLHAARLTPRGDGGKPQRFCSQGCRKQYHGACRLWTEALVGSGLLPVSALRHGLEQRKRSAEGHQGQG